MICYVGNQVKNKQINSITELRHETVTSFIYKCRDI